MSRAATAALVCALSVSVAAAAAGRVRIVSLAPSLTALAYEAGAGPGVVGTVEFSDYPAEARAVPRVGNAFQVDLERVVALDPDLVLAWESGTPERTIEQLERIGLRVVSIATYRIADIAAAIRTIGELAGTEAVADRAAGQFERDLERVGTPRPGARLRVFIQIDDQPLYTVNGEHIISELVERCGGANVFADLDQLAPVVGLEAVLAAEPQVILSTDDTVTDPAAQWRRWPQIPAVGSGSVYGVPADLVAQATTRLVTGLQLICHDLEDARDRLKVTR